jgi:hypothetical protein
MITWTGEGEGVRVANGLADRTIEVEVLDQERHRFGACPL